MSEAVCAILLDLIFAGILVFCLVSGWRSGFAYSVVRIVGLLAALLAALWLSEWVAGAVYERVIYRSLAQSLTNAFAQSDALAALREFLAESRLLRLFAGGAFSPEELAAAGYERTLAFLSESVLRPIAEALVRAVSFLLLFVLFSLLVGLLARMAGLVKKIPVVGGLDRFGGMLIGIVRAVVYALLAALALRLLRLFWPDFPLFSAAVWQRAYLPGLLDGLLGSLGISLFL